MITLPTPPRRAHLRAFWLALSLLVGLIVFVGLIVLKVPYSLAIAAIGSVGVGAIGFISSDWIRPVYASWNRLAATVAWRARQVLMTLCFFVVILPTAQAGAKLSRTQAASASGWCRRPAVAGMSDAERSSEGWTKAYWRWACRSGNLWAVALLPFLLLLSFLAEEDEDTMPAYIYTLF